MSHYSGILRLGALMVLAPLLVWRLAIGRTLGMWSNYREDRHQIALLENTRAQQPVGRAIHEASPELIQSGLLLELLQQQLADYGTVVEKYLPHTTSRQEGATVHTAEITLRGSFHALVRAVDYFETGLTGCRILSVDFRAVRMPNRETTLKVTVIVEQLIIK